MGQVVSGYEPARRQRFVPMTLEQAEALSMSLSAARGGGPASVAADAQGVKKELCDSGRDNDSRGSGGSQHIERKNNPAAHEAVFTATPEAAGGRRCSARSFGGGEAAANTGPVSKRDAGGDGEWLYNLDQLEKERGPQRRLSQSKRRASHNRPPRSSHLEQSTRHHE